MRLGLLKKEENDMKRKIALHSFGREVSQVCQETPKQLGRPRMDTLSVMQRRVQALLTEKERLAAEEQKLVSEMKTLISQMEAA
jgi:hypothetical protein